MTRFLPRWQQLILGSAMLSGFGLSTAALYAIGTRQWLWSDTFHVRAGFRQIQGVEEGTRVRVLGRDAGVVERVDLPASPEGEIVLRLRLDGRLRPLVRADAVAQIVSEGMVGGKVIEIVPGTARAPVVPDNGLIASRACTELADVLGRVGAELKDLHDGQGTLGKLLKDEGMYKELLRLVRQGQGTMNSIKQDADAIKGLPLVRSYVTDTYKILVRPDCERDRRWLAEAQLFEPGRAVLTEGGRQTLDGVGSWLSAVKPKGSEVVIASYSAFGQDPDYARALSQKQSEVVCEYLRSHHGIHKTGWLSRRKVTPLGCGADPPAVPLAERRPGVEVIVFVPQD